MSKLLKHPQYCTESDLIDSLGGLDGRSIILIFADQIINTNLEEDICIIDAHFLEEQFRVKIRSKFKEN